VARLLPAAATGQPVHRVPVCTAAHASHVLERGVQYTGRFAAHHVTAALLPLLDNAALQEIGVASWGHRTELLRALAQRHRDEGTDDEGGWAGGGRQGARARGGARDRSGGDAARGASGEGKGGGGQEGLREVYGQMENLKMHFEAQMENLSRELLATRSQAPARPPSLRVGAPWGQDPWSHRSVGPRPLEPSLRGINMVLFVPK
jgi:hypothetical protein